MRLILTVLDDIHNSLLIGRSCKNVQGGLHQRNVECKGLKVYHNESLGERCIVDVFSTYLSLVPESDELC